MPQFATWTARLDPLSWTSFPNVAAMGRMASTERRARRQFTDEFKAGAVRLVLEEGKTVGAVARELDLTAPRWGYPRS